MPPWNTIKVLDKAWEPNKNLKLAAHRNIFKNKAKKHNTYAFLWRQLN